MNFVIRQRQAARTKMKIFAFVMFPIVTAYLVSCVISHPEEWLLYTILGVIALSCFAAALLLAAKDYLVNETGIRELGLFGKVKLKQYLWSDFAFVGVLDLKARYWDEPEGPTIVCSTFIPKMKYSNSTQYVLGNRGVLKFDYDPELYGTILKLKNMSDHGVGGVGSCG